MNARRIAWSIVGAASLCAATQALDPIAVLSPVDIPPGYWNGFGESVAISGDYIAVGAATDPVYDGTNRGAVYVFRRKGPNWIAQRKLFASNTGVRLQLGMSVAIDGDVIVGGAPSYEPGSCGEHGPGEIFVFRRNDSGTPDDPTDDNWLEEAELRPPNPPSGEHLGVSVGISGDVIVAGPACRGPVEVFRWNGNAWAHEQTLYGSDTQDFYGFGQSVAVDGDRIIVGAAAYDGSRGIAYVFAWNGTTWVEEQRLIPSVHNAYDEFGGSVSISGKYAIVGAHNHGAAYIFERDELGIWVEQVRLTAPPGADVAYFGTGVSINNEIAVVGARGQPWGYEFRREGGVWHEVDELAGIEGGAGATISIDGKYAAVGMYVYAVREQHSLRDYSAFATCFTSSITTVLSPTCQSFDLTGDGRVDLDDFERFVGTFIGPQD